MVGEVGMQISCIHLLMTVFAITFNIDWFLFIHRVSPVNEGLDKGDGGAGDDGEEDAKEDPEQGDALRRIQIRKSQQMKIKANSLNTE